MTTFTNDMPAVANEIAERLAAFREELEQESVSICEIELPAVFVLDDICSTFSLTEHERVWVLGVEGVDFLNRAMSTSVYTVESASGQLETDHLLGG